MRLSITRRAKAASTSVVDWQRLDRKVAALIITRPDDPVVSCAASSKDQAAVRRCEKMRVYTHSDYTVKLPDNHSFPMNRYKGVTNHLSAILDETRTPDATLALWDPPTPSLPETASTAPQLPEAAPSSIISHDVKQDTTCASSSASTASSTMNEQDALLGHDASSSSSSPSSSISRGAAAGYKISLGYDISRNKDMKEQQQPLARDDAHDVPEPWELLHIDRDPRLATRDEAALSHEWSYISRFENGDIPVKLLGFPWSKDFVRRTYRILGSTLDALEDVLLKGALQEWNAGKLILDAPPGISSTQHDEAEQSLSNEDRLKTIVSMSSGRKTNVIAGGNLAGGTHHAFPDSAEGFCVYNDLAVAARYAQALLGLPMKRPAANKNMLTSKNVGESESTVTVDCERSLEERKREETSMIEDSTVDEKQELEEIDAMKILVEKQSINVDTSENYDVRLQHDQARPEEEKDTQDASSTTSLLPTAYSLLREKLNVHPLIVILDVDVHQGNGTAACFVDDPSVITFSLHSAKNYPFGDRRRVSDIERDVPNDVSEEAYLAKLQDGLAEVNRKLLFRDEGDSSTQGGNIIARNDKTNDTKSMSKNDKTNDTRRLLVLWQAGVDPLAEDRLGKLKLSRRALWRRNRMVLEWCRNWNALLVVTMGGGYSRPIEHSIRAHADVYLQTAFLAKKNWLI
ncbi:unnamed protein product [Amoebophrya sp. A25]|nr:unnamed protein product [Amoebophrya sp. A25]|eukprot:GSA25T00013158001.1